MNIFKYISFLLIVIISLLSSCAKMDSPKEIKSSEVKADATYVGNSKIMINDDTTPGDTGITDPDNDEDHDRDEVSNNN